MRCEGSDREEREGAFSMGERCDQGRSMCLFLLANFLRKIDSAVFKPKISRCDFQRFDRKYVVSEQN